MRQDKVSRKVSGELLVERGNRSKLNDIRIQVIKGWG